MRLALVLPLIVALVGMETLCSAQPAATLRVTHNHSTGLVAPGETVQIKFTLSWTGAPMFLDIRGDAVASPNAGAASNQAFQSGITMYPATIVNLGVASGASVLGVHINSGLNPTFPGTHLYWEFGPLLILSYDWTAPTSPGTVDFNWVPDPAQPNPRLYAMPSLAPTSVPTTYLGTSLTVVPTPAGGVIVLGGLACCARRRR